MKRGLPGPVMTAAVITAWFVSSIIPVAAISYVVVASITMGIGWFFVKLFRIR